MGKHASVVSRRRPWRGLIAATLTLSLLGTAVWFAQKRSEVSAAGTTQTIAQDAFNRTLTGNWGSAAVGGAYTSIAAGSGATLGVNGGAGSISGITAGRSVRASLKSVAVGDVDAQSDVSLPVGVGTGVLYHSTRARIQTDNSSYGAKVMVIAGGKLNLTIDRDNGYTGTNLSYAAPSVSWAVNQKLHVELRVTGMTPVIISARVWNEGSEVPPWQATYTDSSGSRVSTSGGVGIEDYASHASQSVLIDDLSASTVVAGSAPTFSSSTSLVSSSTRSTTSANTTTVADTTTSATSTKSTTGQGTTTTAKPSSTPSTGQTSTKATSTATSTSTPKTSSASSTSTASTPVTTAKTTPTTTTSSRTSSSSSSSTTSTSTSTSTRSTTTTTTTTTTQPPIGAPAPQPSRGAAAPGGASYSVPAGAIYVSTTSGNDAAAGSAAAPLKTVTAAINKAASGATVVLHGGTYHETVTIPASKSGLTLEAYPGEAVWFDGSVPVSGWTKSGSVWVHSGWTATFDSSASFTTGVNYPSMVLSTYPMAAHPDMVFFNGGQLAQVASAAQVKAGTFAVDYGSHTITVGSDPTGADVRASDISKAFAVQGSSNLLQGFGIRRFATPVPQMGAMTLSGSSNTVRNVTFSNNATLGVSVAGKNATLDHLTVDTSGLLGVHGNYADGITVQNSSITNSNSEHFNSAPTSSGIKLTKSRGVRILNDNVSHNNSMGFWCDQSCVNITVANSTMSDNAAAGILLEVSQTSIVANNVLSNNQQGLYLLDTGGVKIYNNALENNSVQDIAMIQDHRRQATPEGGENDPRYPVPDPTCPWLVKDNFVANNAFGSGGYFQTYVLDKETHIAADSMNVNFVGNLFNIRPTTAAATQVGWGGTDLKIDYRYDTPAAQKAKNATWINLQTKSVESLSTMGPEIAAAKSIAVPLPADVAAAVGQPIGTKQVGIFN